jgi:hypothetical protein
MNGSVTKEASLYMLEFNKPPQPRGSQLRVVDIAHRGGVREKRDFIRELPTIRVVQAVGESLDDQARRRLRHPWPDDDRINVLLLG